MTDSEALRKLIESKGLKMKFVADYLGLSAYGLQLKVDNRQEFKTSEVAGRSTVAFMDAKWMIFFCPIN